MKTEPAGTVHFRATAGERVTVAAAAHPLDEPPAGYSDFEKQLLTAIADGLVAKGPSYRPWFPPARFHDRDGRWLNLSERNREKDRQRAIIVGPRGRWSETSRLLRELLRLWRPRRDRSAG